MQIKGTKNSPSVLLSSEECKFEIKGFSYSETINEIYDKAIKWINDNIPKINCEINFIFNLYVTNSISDKKILLIIDRLNNFFLEGKKIKIKWCALEDEDSIEYAEDILTLFKLPIEIIEE